MRLTWRLSVWGRQVLWRRHLLGTPRMSSTGWVRRAAKGGGNPSLLPARGPINKPSQATLRRIERKRAGQKMPQDRTAEYSRRFNS